MVLNLLNCSDGGSPGDDTQLHIASGQGESRDLRSMMTLMIRMIVKWCKASVLQNTRPELPPVHQGRPQSSLWWWWSSQLLCICLTEDGPATKALKQGGSCGQRLNKEALVAGKLERGGLLSLVYSCTQTLPTLTSTTTLGVNTQGEVSWVSDTHHRFLLCN